MKKAATIQKNIRFSKSVVALIEPKAKRLGYSFTDYVKFLVAKDIENEVFDKDFYVNDIGANQYPYEKVEDEELNNLIADILQARKDSKAGKLPVLKTSDDIDNFFDSL